MPCYMYGPSAQEEERLAEDYQDLVKKGEELTKEVFEKTKQGNEELKGFLKTLDVKIDEDSVDSMTPFTKDDFLTEVLCSTIRALPQESLAKMMLNSDSEPTAKILRWYGIHAYGDVCKNIWTAEAEARRGERIRVENIRQEALKKLTPEERKVLELE